VKVGSAIVLVLVASGNEPASIPLQASFVVEAKPLVDIGPEGGGYLMHDPSGAIRLASGTIVIADTHGGVVYYFDASGRLLRSVGRQGDGPGEFRHISWIGLCRPDSIFAWDLVRRRMLVLTEGGVVAEEYPVPAEPLTGPAPYTVTCSHRGVFVFQPLARILARTTPDLPFGRGRARVSIGDSHGGITGLIDDVYGSEIVVFGGGAGPRPLGKSTVFAVGSDRIYIGTADSASINVFTFDGRRLPPIALEVSSRLPSQKNYEQAVEEIVSSVRGPARGAVRTTLLNLPKPGTLPPYRSLLVDSDDLLWVVLSAAGDSSTRLRVLDKAGRRIGEVLLPVPLYVTDIGRDYILGTYTDLDGLTHVAMYRLRRGS